MRTKYARIAVKLSKSDLQKIKGILTKGKFPVGVIKRALTLRLLNKGHSPPEAAEAISLSPKTARKTGRNYVEGGLSCALYDAPRKGRRKSLDEKQSSKIIALLCSNPPDGFKGLFQQLAGKR